MDLVFAIFVIIGGLAYIMYKYHQEFNGGLTAAFMMVLFVCGPLAVWQWVLNEVNIVAGIVGLIAHIVVLCYVLLGPLPDKWAKEANIESAKLWEEVNALPVPDNSVLRQYKIANKIPLYPEDSEVFNQAAVKCWRISEYNKRFKEKHKLVYYQKI